MTIGTSDSAMSGGEHSEMPDVKNVKKGALSRLRINNGTLYQ